MMPKAGSGPAATQFRGPFEGLWTDREDVDSVIERRLRARQISEVEGALLRDWVRQGYVILPDALPEELC